MYCTPSLWFLVVTSNGALRSEGVSHSYRIYDQTGTALTAPSKWFLPFLNPSLLILASSPPRQEYHPDLSPGRSDVKRWLS